VACPFPHEELSVSPKITNFISVSSLGGYAEPDRTPGAHVLWFPIFDAPPRTGDVLDSPCYLCRCRGPMGASPASQATQTK